MSPNPEDNPSQQNPTAGGIAGCSAWRYDDAGIIQGAPPHRTWDDGFDSGLGCADGLPLTHRRPGFSDRRGRWKCDPIRRFCFSFAREDVKCLSTQATKLPREGNVLVGVDRGCISDGCHGMGALVKS
jgi:hypothetical protein